MEKLVYVLWKPPGVSGDAFVERARGRLAEALVGLGSQHLGLCLVDARAERLASARLTRLDPPPAGLASFWLEPGQPRAPFEAALSAACSRMAGYAVEESVPLAFASPCGDRMEGIDMVALLERPERLSRQLWLERWLEQHRQVALETQSTFLYVRNVVERAVTAGAPPYEGIVEEGFAEDAIGHPERWYDAEGDPEKLRANLARMIESCRSFLDLDRVESHPMSRYPVQP